MAAAQTNARLFNPIVVALRLALFRGFGAAYLAHLQRASPVVYRMTLRQWEEARGAGDLQGRRQHVEALREIRHRRRAFELALYDAGRQARA